MRISYLLHQFSPKHTSPVEKYCFNLAKEMKRRGNEVSIFVYQYSKQNAKLQKGTTDMMYDGIGLREVYHNYSMKQDADEYEYYNPVIKDYADLYFKEFKPDIVHILHLKNLSASVIDSAYENKIPMIFTPTDFWTLCPNFTLLRADFDLCRGPLLSSPCQICLGTDEDTLGQRIMEKKHQPLSMMLKEKAADSFISNIGKKLFSKMADSMKVQKQWTGVDKQIERKDFILKKCDKIAKILAPSEFMKAVLVENGYDESKITVLPLGFDITPPEKVEKEFTEKLRIGYIGTINRHKGVHLLIQAMRGINNDNVELKIYGDFTRFHKYTQRLKTLIGHDKRILLMGTFRPDRMDEIFNEIDILAVPSLWYEHVPAVIYSAFVHKTPVLAPSFGPLTEIVQHSKNGILFWRNDPASIKEKIMGILNDMSILRKISAGMAPPKTMTEQADELLEVFEKFTYCDKF